MSRQFFPGKIRFVFISLCLDGVRQHFWNLEISAVDCTQVYVIRWRNGLRVRHPARTWLIFWKFQEICCFPDIKSMQNTTCRSPNNVLLINIFCYNWKYFANWLNLKTVSWVCSNKLDQEFCDFMTTLGTRILMHSENFGGGVDILGFQNFNPKVLFYWRATKLGSRVETNSSSEK